MDWMVRGLPAIPAWQAGARQAGMASRAGCAAPEVGPGPAVTRSERIGLGLIQAAGAVRR